MLNSILGLFVNAAHAAADPVVASTTEGIANSVQENMVSVVSTVAPILSIIFVIILGVYFVLKMTRRVSK